VSDITQILNAIDAGDPRGASQLLPLVYDELRKLAAAKMAAESPGQTLNATALVHEAYLRLVTSRSPPVAAGGISFANRRHFFASAAEAMRRILIDNARLKRRPKHGGGRDRVPLDDALLVSEPPENLLAIDEALTRLTAEQPAKAELVKLRYFGGLTLDEAAACLDISPATAKRYWSVARAWLYNALADGDR
jgi:RNA polymerase sigma factor (TIGR02999 family)